MRQDLLLLTLAVALTSLVGGTTTAWAEESGVALEASREGGPASGVTGVFAAGALDESRLDGLRGGAENKLSKIVASGTVSEVTAHDLVTGNNIISDGSLAGASGMPMLIQNSGNGVLIQNAVIVNVEMN